MIVRFGLGLLVVILLFLLLVYSDFYLTRRIKERIGRINGRAESQFGYRPLDLPHCTVIALLLWLPSYYMLTCSLLLEYRLMLTLLYWGAGAGGLYSYGRQRASSLIARQSLPFWLVFALAAGCLLLPGMAGIHGLL